MNWKQLQTPRAKISELQKDSAFKLTIDENVCCLQTLTEKSFRTTIWYGDFQANRYISERAKMTIVAKMEELANRLVLQNPSREGENGKLFIYTPGSCSFWGNCRRFSSVFAWVWVPGDNSISHLACNQDRALNLRTSLCNCFWKIPI